MIPKFKLNFTNRLGSKKIYATAGWITLYHKKVYEVASSRV